MFANSWSDEDVEILRTEWAGGLSASQIGTMIGKTRCAVLGKVHRLGLPLRNQNLVKRTPSTATYQPRVKALPLVLVEAGPALVLDDGSNVTAMTVNDNMCRWPIGDPAQADFHFCGNAPEKGVYCAAHARAAYVPSKPLMPRDHRRKLQSL